MPGLLDPSQRCWLSKLGQAFARMAKRWLGLAVYTLTALRSQRQEDFWVWGQSKLHGETLSLAIKTNQLRGADALSRPREAHSLDFLVWAPANTPNAFLPRKKKYFLAMFQVKMYCLQSLHIFINLTGLHNVRAHVYKNLILPGSDDTHL